MTKPFYSSKTFWVNILGGVIVLAQYTNSIHLVDPTVLGGVMVVLNLLLRSITNTGITFK